MRVIFEKKFKFYCSKDLYKFNEYYDVERAGNQIYMSRAPLETGFIFRFVNARALALFRLLHTLSKPTIIYLLYIVIIHIYF